MYKRQCWTYAICYAIGSLVTFGIHPHQPGFDDRGHRIAAIERNSVSYTHLDVYKRQAYGGFRQASPPLMAHMCITIPMSCSAFSRLRLHVLVAWLLARIWVSVSYTHLDVYKRQVLHIDMDAFFASLEVARHPEYADKPVIIGIGNQMCIRDSNTTSTTAATMASLRRPATSTSGLQMCIRDSPDPRQQPRHQHGKPQARECRA